MGMVASSRYRIGIDIGGTFTDLQILNERTGEIFEHKTPTTPADPSIGFFQGIEEASGLLGFGMPDVSMVIHGTTIATNAVLEMKMPEAALITTAGFEDVLEIGRHLRKDLHGLYAEPRKLLIARNRRFGVVERIGADGRVLTELDAASLKQCADSIRKAEIGIVAVCLMNAYANADHERRIKAFLEDELPGVFVSLSSDISPEIREYERMSTTVLNARLMPVVRNYVDRLSGKTADKSMSSPILLVQSNGGVTGLKKAGEEPAKLLLSGPCGGALAAEEFAKTLGSPNLIAIDMGGTSFDISIVNDGKTTMVNAGDIDGLPIRLPMVEMRTIGAGGGSIAWSDGTGRLRVGPQSASSVPGPACYGRGGTQATVTDANVVLGRIDPATFLGGRMPLDAEKSVAAFRNTICADLDLSVNEAAAGVIQIVNSRMASAIKLSLFERGLDPSDFACISFGGAGGLHAIEVAAEVGVKKVIFPRSSSTLSAYGMLWSDVVHDAARTLIRGAGADALPDILAAVADMQAATRPLLDKDGIPAGDQAFEVFLDLRYKGQGYELKIPLDGALDGAALERAVAGFHKEHLARFSHAEETQPVELVTVRMRARGSLAKPRLADARPSGAGILKGLRRSVINGHIHDVPVYLRNAIAAGVKLHGPLVIEEDYTTLFVPDGWSIDMLASGDIVANAAS